MALELHLIVDNYSTHKHEQVKKWLAKHPRLHFHFIPTCGWAGSFATRNVARSLFSPGRQAHVKARQSKARAARHPVS